MTKIVTTIGPASSDIGSLMYFKEHDVEIARLNFSHNDSNWHIETAKRARQAGLKVLFDLSGPKLMLGSLTHSLEISTGSEIILEKEKVGIEYPCYQKRENKNIIALPLYYSLDKFVKPGDTVLIDDGKVELEVETTEENKILCKVIFGGLIKNHKGINLPNAKVDLDFLVERDRVMLSDTLAKFKPDYIAPSFVQTIHDINKLNEFVQSILDENGVKDYKPMICTKVEMGEAVKEENLEKIVDASEMIMIARGDLALETKPAHLMVPFLQDKIKKICNEKNKPFIVATQMMESMINTSVPTRAEISDLYRAIYLDKADYIMLSGESAAGEYPKRTVDFMHQMIRLGL
jgi:pyruvate kinase